MAQDRVDNLFAGENWTAVYTAFTNVSLKSYDFDSIREALLSYVSITYPDKFNDFIASSEFIAILDIVAYLGHSLAFRTDLNSRENFLDTAERRESILRLAKTLGYEKSRPTNARGYLKITSIKTTQAIKDSYGKSLANKKINWNDSNNDDWYDDFVTILNSALTKDSKVNDPVASLTLAGGENYLHYINENPATKSTRYSFSTNIASAKRKFDVVRAEFTDNKILESEPNSNGNMTIIARDDNLGPASDRTGFFVFSKAGELRFKDFDYVNKLSNRIEHIADVNISNTDVWVQKLTSGGNYQKSVTIIDNTTRQNAIYNALRSGSNDLASVQTLMDNTIQITYPDGIYGNAAYGRYRVWYRISDNASFNVNRDDIRNVSISIPYIGEDGRPYKLDLTLNSTLDFTENFSGENYYSVKRLAPQAYYTQDRMVNGQDYNVLPLTLGSSIITKAKAVNTTFAGNSRFFEMDDVTGHHSTITVNGTDGSVYFEDEELRVEFYLNPQQADIDSFIRNDLVKTIAHPIIENQFYYLYKNDPLVKRDLTLVDDYIWEIDPANPSNILKGVISPTPDVIIKDGDYLKIGDYWYTVMDFNNDVITLDRPATYGSLVKEYVYGYVKVFTDDEVDTIKDIISDTNSDTFYLAYDFPEGEGLSWSIRTENELTPQEIETIENSGLYVKVEYRPGIRRTESRFIATMVGKNIVFESRDQVKFFYSNNLNTVIDNETNKPQNDSIFINYHSGYIQEKGLSESEEYTLTVGYGPVVDVDEIAGTFTISYENSGAELNYNYIETANPYITGVTYVHEVVSPDGLTVEIPLSTPPYADGTFDINLVSEITQDISIIYDDVVVEEVNVSFDDIVAGPFTPNHAETANTSNTASHYNDYIDLTTEQLETFGFIGTINLGRISTLLDDNKLFFMDESSILSEGSTLADATLGEVGTQTPMVLSEDTNVYRFVFTQNEGFPVNDLYQINENDADIYFKQLPYSQFEFTATEVYTIDDIIVRLMNGSYVPSGDYTLMTPTETGIANTYRIIFWTPSVQIGETIDIYTGVNGGTLEECRYHGRITATITQQAPTQIKVNSYKTIGSMVASKYVTDQGYIDYSKVIISSKDIDGDPYAMIDMISSIEVDTDNGNTTSVETTHYVVLEDYTFDNKEYQRVSSYAVAFAEDVYMNDNIPETATLYYDVDSTNWYYRTTQGWVLTTSYTTISDNEIEFNGTVYKVVEGKSFVVDEYMSYRWDHYADKDKRIDPSTSNIIDVYVLTTDYVNRINEWKNGGFISSVPVAPTTFELNKLMENINTKAAIADHISYIPAKFKFLFGTFADEQNQAYFKVVKRSGTTYTDSEIKSKVAEKVNEYFDLNKWDFGETFYFSELAAYLHVELGDYIASVIITPKYATYDFRNMLSISCDINEIFMSLVTSANVKIIDRLTSNDLTGE